MVSKFSIAKILKRTNADHVIEALEEFYNVYGTPIANRTDNGPPFNSESFREFLDKKGIKHEKVFPYHPNSNPVETLMKSLGKAMKIAHDKSEPLDKALRDFLAIYRATPHISTGIAPGDFLLRHGYEDSFPKNQIPDDMETEEAQQRDQQAREERDNRLNETRMEPKLKIGQWVLTKNTRKTNKFDPTFGPELMKIVSTEADGAVCEDQNGKQQRRHADDIKIIDIPETTQQHHTNTAQGTDNNEEQTNNNHDTQESQKEAQNRPLDPKQGKKYRKQNEVSKEVQPSSSSESTERRYPLKNRKPNHKYSQEA